MSTPSINPAAVQAMRVRLVYGHGRRVVHATFVASGRSDALRQATAAVASRSRITEMPTSWEVIPCHA